MPSGTKFVFANFLETQLLDDISANATLLHITPAMSARLQKFTNTDVTEARLILWDGINLPEIVSVNDNQWTGYLSVLRAREGTSSRPWPAGTQVICALTAEVINAALAAYYDISSLMDLTFLKLAGGTLTGPLILAANPTLPLGAVTKQYADSVLGDKLPLSGGTMLGTINMNAQRILNLPAPVSNAEPVRKVEYDASNLLQTQNSNDAAGIISTSGTADAFSLTSYRNFLSKASMDNAVIAFVPHTTNVDDPTLNVDGLGAVPLRRVIGVNNVKAGFLVEGTTYTAVYRFPDDTFYLRDFYGNPYNIPLAGGMDYWAPTVPNSSFAFPIGQAISRSVYADLFNLIGTTYGPGNGATTFNLPDKPGRVSAMIEPAAARLTAGFFGGNSTQLGAVGGLEKHLLDLTQLPTGINSSGANAISVASTTNDVLRGTTHDNFTSVAGDGGVLHPTGNQITSTNPTQAIAVASNNTGGLAHPNCQPTILCNYIMRIL